MARKPRSGQQRIRPDARTAAELRAGHAIVTEAAAGLRQTGKLTFSVTARPGLPGLPRPPADSRPGPRPGRNAAGQNQGRRDPEFRGYAADELARLRTTLIRSLSLPEDENILRESYLTHLRAGFQDVLADSAVLDHGRQASLLVDAEALRLRKATAWWVSPRLTKKVLEDAPGMPVFRPRPGDMPSPWGLMYFAVPFAAFEPSIGVLSVDTGSGEVFVPPPVRPQLCAVSWGPWDDNGRWPGGGTWFTFWTALPRSIDDRAAYFGISRQQAMHWQIPPLFIDNEVTCPASDGIPLPGGIPLEEAVRWPGSRYRWMHVVLCAAREIASRQGVRVTDQPPRSAKARRERDRAHRAGVSRPGEPVRLVDVAPPPRRTSGAAAGNGPGGRKLDYRQTVSGHWKNQWHPREGRHVPTRVEEYERGPKGAPLRPPRDKVYVIRERGESARRPRGAAPEPEM